MKGPAFYPMIKQATIKKIYSPIHLNCVRFIEKKGNQWDLHCRSYLFIEVLSVDKVRFPSPAPPFYINYLRLLQVKVTPKSYTIFTDVH